MVSPFLTFFARRDPDPRRRQHPHVPVPDEAPTTDAIFIVLRRMRAPLVFITIVFGISMLGLTLIPGQDKQGHATHLTMFEAFYFTAYTASTIGFGELTPFTTGQRMWVTACIFMTVVGWAYAIGTLLSLLQSTSFQNAVAMQRFRTKVKRLREPFLIVCGYGQAGRTVCRQLDSVGRRFVVVDSHQRCIEKLSTDELLSDVAAIEADAALPAVLGMAGLGNPHCEGVLALTDHDTGNLSIVMAASVLRPELRVIARCSDRVVEDRMHDFAPNAVINPSDRYGAYLVLALQRPATYRLVSWLMNPHDGLPRARYENRGTGTWVVCADGTFADEVSADLTSAGMDVVRKDPQDGHPDVSGARGLVAGTDDDTTNLALAEHAKLANPNLFVAVRQQSAARSSILTALGVDSVFTPTDLVAQETLARVVTPLFWGFIEHAVSQDNAFSENLLEKMTQRCGADEDSGKDRALVSLSASSSPAIHRWLLGHDLTIGELLRHPHDRDNELRLVVLALVRNGENTYAPDESTPLRPDDELLVAGHRGAIAELSELQFSDARVEYVATGEQVPETWVWRRIVHRRRDSTSV